MSAAGTSDLSMNPLIHVLQSWSVSHAGGSPAWGQLLLAWSASLTNFADTAQANRFFGWSADTVNEPCSWSGIDCSADGFTMLLPKLGLTGMFLG